MLAPVPRHARRLAYLGTPGLAVPALQALHEAGYELPLVVSRADKRRGRRGRPEPSPVKAAAIELGLSVSDRVDDVLDVDVDLGVVVAFGRLIKPHVLAAVPMVNVHYSLLPRWRGAAPLERAILAGDPETGVCLMQIEEGLDSGGVFAREVVGIGEEDTYEDVLQRLIAVSTDLLLTALAEGLGEPEPQHGEPTYAEKIESEDLHLDWSRPARELSRVIRLGRAWTTFRGRRLKILRARVVEPDADRPSPGHLVDLRVGTGEGSLELVEVQAEGKHRQLAGAWLNGARPELDDSLGL